MVRLAFVVSLDEEEQQWDLKEAFEAIDDDKRGRLTIEQAYTLLLGLGYLKYNKDAKDQFTPSDMRAAVQSIQKDDISREPGGQEFVTLEVLHDILEMHRPLLLRDRQANIRHGFQLFDQAHKGAIDTSDIQRLAADLGDEIPREEAHAMLVTTRKLIEEQSSNFHTEGTKDSKTAERSIDFETFRKVMSPPEG